MPPYKIAPSEVNVTAPGHLLDDVKGSFVLVNVASDQLVSPDLISLRGS